MNIELTINGSLIKNLKTKPFSLAVKKKLFEIDNRYKNLLNEIKAFSIDDLVDLGIDEKQISKLREQMTVSRDKNMVLSMFLLEQSTKNPKLKNVLDKKLTEEQEIEYSIYKLEVLKAIIDIDNIRTEDHKKGFQSDIESEFYLNLDLREVSKIIDNFRNPQQKSNKQG